MAYEAEVAAGAAWLDEHVGPGWEAKIDLGTLEMDRCDACIKGQLIRNLYGDRVFNPLTTGELYAGHYPPQLGFDIPDSDPDLRLQQGRESCKREYLKLEAAWVAELKRRSGEFT
jgi:hypothetical protein